MSEGRSRAGRLFAELGVIILGVLIAFWVENYREHRSERQEERVLLEALRDEFAANREDLLVTLQAYARRHDAQRTLIQLGEAAGSLPLDSATVLWAYALRGGTLDVADGVLNSAFGAGRLSLIRDPELQQLIARWPSEVENFRHIDERYAEFRQLSMLAFLVPRIEAPPMFGALSVEAGISADGDYTAVLGTPEFDRLLTWAARYQDVYEAVGRELVEFLDDIEARLADALEE